jgi:hypothetical protein
MILLKTRLVLPFLLLGLSVIVLLSIPPAWAHTHRVLTINGKQIEFVVGWVVEPPYAGEVNAIDVWAHYVNATCPQGTVSTTCPVYGLDQTLRVEVSTGGQTQTLNLSPNLSNDVPPLFYGEYTANIEPTVPGSYTFTIFGNIGATAVNQTFACGPTTFECVDPANEIQFPQPDPTGADLQTALSNSQSQITQLQGTVQTALATAGIGIAVGLLGLAAAIIGISRGRGQRIRRTTRKRA